MGESTENKEKKEKAPLPVRSCVVMALAGAYVMYTGYNLCHHCSSVRDTLFFICW